MVVSEPLTTIDMHDSTIRPKAPEPEAPQPTQDQRLIGVLNELSESKRYEIRAARFSTQNGKPVRGTAKQTVCTLGGEKYVLSDFIGASPRTIDGPEYRTAYPYLVEAEQFIQKGEIRMKILRIIAEAERQVA